MNIEEIYKNLGEFVVSFQWLENRFREIGWLITDPERKSWPPKALRTEDTDKLIDKVQKLYCDAIDRIAPQDAEERKQSFREIVKKPMHCASIGTSLFIQYILRLKQVEKLLDCYVQIPD